MSDSNERDGETDAPRSKLKGRLSRLRKDGAGAGPKETELAPAREKEADGAEAPAPVERDGGAEEEKGAEGRGHRADEPAEEKEDAPAQRGGAARGRGRESAAADLEAGGGPAEGAERTDAGSKVVISAPLAVLEPHRTDPMHSLRQRHKKLERAAAASLPELHFAGQIVSGQGLIQDSTEGCCCRWKVDYGSCWQLLGGETAGQTQIAYARNHHSNPVPFNHPIDIHIAESGIQGKGSPCIMLQCYRLDWHGRLILAGYGFAHLPTTSGLHNIEVPLWIPVGSTSQELDSYFLGRTPALVEQGPIYETAWKERCRLVTAPAGTVNAQIFVVTRHMALHGMD